MSIEKGRAVRREKAVAFCVWTLFTGPSHYRPVPLLIW